MDAPLRAGRHEHAFDSRLIERICRILRQDIREWTRGAVMYAHLCNRNMRLHVLRYHKAVFDDVRFFNAAVFDALRLAVEITVAPDEGSFVRPSCDC